MSFITYKYGASVTDPRVAFFDGLLWYLETRQWAREKIEACPHGSSEQDIKMFHYLYFANLFEPDPKLS